MKRLHIVWGMENGGAENMLADIMNTQVCTDDVSLLVINDMLDSSILERINKKCKFIFLRRKVSPTSTPFSRYRLAHQEVVF